MQKQIDAATTADNLKGNLLGRESFTKNRLEQSSSESPFGKGGSLSSTRYRSNAAALSRAWPRSPPP